MANSSDACGLPIEDLCLPIENIVLPKLVTLNRLSA